MPDTKKDNRIREVVYAAHELADWLRSLLADLNKGDTEEAKRAIREAINKIGA